MSKIIPNANSFVGFNTTIANIASPTAAEIAASKNLTPLLISITASSSGNAVPTPTLDTLFETSVPGTSSAQFTADFYRDNTNDLAWDTLPRGTKGYMLISRFGGTGADRRPATGQKLEVWPIHIISRGAGPLSSNTAQTFTCTASVPAEPNENATAAI